MKDKAELRKALLDHLEGALAIADELNESAVGYLIETALDQARSRDIDRLRGQAT